MNIIEIIDKKRLNKELTKEEIYFFINGIIKEEIKDYQTSSLLMAITINGMTDEEIVYLTNAMKESGEIVNLESLNKIIVDKHSTGGVGDKTTLIVGPIVAACDVCVAKMSGRGLGFTGGTIDKFESIENFNVNLSLDEFINQLKDINIAIVSQMANLVKADKILYALRDVTATVSSLPLIASSIMSKKLASNADKIVIDVKVGNGALMKTKEEALELARLMIKIGKANNKEIICILSNMNQPLGYAIGNSLEVEEAISILSGNKQPNDLYELVLELSTNMVSLGKNISKEKAREEVIFVLENGLALEKFKQLIKYQGGDINNLQNECKIFSIKSLKQGYIKSIDTQKLGELTRQIGAGRYFKEDKIDYGVGIVLSKKIGDFVSKDEEIMKVYLKNKDIKIMDLLSCFEFSEKEVIKEKLIIDIITDVK